MQNVRSTGNGREFTWEDRGRTRKGECNTNTGRDEGNDLFFPSQKHPFVCNLHAHAMIFLEIIQNAMNSCFLLKK
jgi:hypothetical protein